MRVLSSLSSKHIYNIVIFMVDVFTDGVGEELQHLMQCLDLIFTTPSNTSSSGKLAMSQLPDKNFHARHNTEFPNILPTNTNV